MYKVILLSICSFLLITSCNLIKPKFSSDIIKTEKKYKDILNAESINVVPNWSKFDTVVTSSIIITILNPTKLPKNVDDLDTLGLKIAKDYYYYLINKNDYSEIKIVFNNSKGIPLVANFQTNQFFTYTFDKLENSNDSIIINKNGI